MLAKIDVWFSSRKVQKAIAKISPRYLARSPVNIFHAIKFMTPALLTLFPRRRLRFVPSRALEGATSNLLAQLAGRPDCIAPPSPSRNPEFSPRRPKGDSLAVLSYST